jgi:predicted dehydrogenase
MTDKLGFGVVGLNPRIRRSILAGIAGSRRARLAAVCSRDPAKAAGATAEFGGRPYSSYEAMLEDRSVEAVFIATPHHLHHPMALAAIAAGRQVVCEKPLALTLGEAEEMAAAALRSGRPHAVNFTYHSLPGQAWVARLVEQGEAGTIRHLDLTYWQAREALPDAKRGDALLEVGSHEIDLAAWWGALGRAGSIRSVVSQEWRPDTTLPEWTPIWAALARTDGGAVLALQANRVAAGWRNGIVARIVGDEGAVTLRFDTDAVEVEVARFGDGGPEGVARPRPIPPDLAVSYQEFPAYHLDRLAAALQGQGEFPDFAYGLAIQRIIDAMQRSAAEGRWIAI